MEARCGWVKTMTNSKGWPWTRVFFTHTRCYRDSASTNPRTWRVSKASNVQHQRVAEVGNTQMVKDYIVGWTCRKIDTNEGACLLKLSTMRWSKLQQYVWKLAIQDSWSLERKRFFCGECFIFLVVSISWWKDCWLQGWDWTLHGWCGTIHFQGTLPINTLLIKTIVAWNLLRMYSVGCKWLQHSHHGVKSRKSHNENHATAWCFEGFGQLVARH